MSLYVTDFLNSRIEEITQTLKTTNGEYALAVEKRKSLFENIDPIIHHDRDITISSGDCMDFCEYFDHDFIATAIMQQELYKQGYLDCIQLLSMLEVLS